MRIAPLAMALCLAACSDTAPVIQPLPRTQSAETSPFDQAYQAGKSHLMADRAGFAIVMFEQALARDPLSVAALNGLGAAYDQLNRPEVAKRYYLKALALEPGGADTLNNMAISAALAGDAQTARDLLGRAANLAPANATIRANLLIASVTQPGGVPGPETDRPRLERSGLMEVTLIIPATASIGHAAVQLAALAGGTIDRAGLVPYAPGGKVTSEALAPLPAFDHQSDKAVVSVGTGDVPAAPPPLTRTAGRPGCVVEVSNGAGRNHLADRVRTYLADHGAAVGRLTNAGSFDNAQTILFHRPDGEAEARRLSALLPAGVTLHADPGLECSIRLQLGRDFLAFDQSLSNGDL